MGCRCTALYILNLTIDRCELLAPTARLDMLQETYIKSILHHRLTDEHSQSVLGVVAIWKRVVTDGAQFTH
jgi:hypothetical protein